METQKAVRTNQVKQVIFELGDEEYGLDIMLVNAIVKPTDVVRIPNAPSYVRGIINLRGDVIPVYSLRRKFGLGDKEIDDNSKLIITKTGNLQMAYEVDLVKEIMEISSEHISETPVIVKNEDTAYIKCVANVEGRMILLLNQDGLLSSNEKQTIINILENQ